MLLGPLRLVFKILFLLVLAVVVYFVVTLVQVWLTSRATTTRVQRRPLSSWARPSTTACRRRTSGLG